MKKILLAFLLTLLLFSFNVLAQNTGIGTATPENKLHILKGSAGTVTGYSDAPLIVENSTNCFINILAPDANESGILFGSPFSSNVDGGIIYNGNGINGFQFRTNGNITRMVLDELGNLGLGTTDMGGDKMRVSHSDVSGGFGIQNASNLNHWELSLGVSSLFLYFNGHYRGSFNSFDGSYSSLSDERLKTNIKPMSSMLEKINQLKPFSYQFKYPTNNKEYNGFIAQDVMKLFPSLVVHNVNPARKLDVYTINYSGFGVIAVKGIQELHVIIEEQNKINELQQRQINEFLKELQILKEKLK
ncbi:MAG TPA: tail fiber domain-containing protein [Ferruginibacter sp.]|nr:tail fiber domain-containing protein [Ferruginibacter sp.]